MQKIRLLLAWAAGCVSIGVSAQSPDSVAALPLREVLISGIRAEIARENTLNITALSRDDLQRSGVQTLANALTQLPGVGRLGTGVGIAKPVVRGLYGNRVLVLLSSLKFDNQQWQDEHGLGLSDVGVGRVELIKGPAAVLYGSEAVGGVINILEERPEPGRRRQGDAGLRLFANTRGLGADVGCLGNTARGWWRLRAGVDSHADYDEGGGARVLNSRFGSYVFKATLGRDRARRQQVFDFASSISNFGFILGDSTIQLSPDGRGSRRLSGPHHTVLLNVFSVQQTFLLENSVLRVNAGLQSNVRLEDEGGGAISLNMHLLSLPYHVQWSLPLDRRNELILSNNAAFERNTNYGGRIIVPDANLAEEGVAACWRRKTAHWVLEAGAGLNDKFIQTLPTRSVNTPDKELRPFRRNRVTVNGLLGFAWNPSARWNLKAHAASGFRAPNLAELASDGLHEGIFRYEIGNPRLNNEQNLQVETEVNYTGKALSAGLAAFVNQFFGYLYLAPTGQDTLGFFPLYRYRQADARLWGGEAYCRLKCGGWQWNNSLALVRGQRTDGANLPFIPPPRWVSRLEWRGAWARRLPEVWAYAEGETAGRQNRLAADETLTPAYFLLHAGAGFRRGRLTLGLVGRNLLDRRYFDHLSRFKNYPLPFYDVGRDLVLSARFGF